MDASRPSEGLLECQIVRSVGGSGETCLVMSRASEKRAGRISTGRGGEGGGGGNGTPLLAQRGHRQPPPAPPLKRHHSIASEAGAGCGFVGQIVPVATKYRRGREALNLWPAATKGTDSSPSRDRRVPGTRSRQRLK